VELKVKRFDFSVKLPTVTHPGEDLGFDVYAPFDFILHSRVTRKIALGIGLELEGHGFLMQDRSSLAQKGVTISGGVIDAGYRGEISAVMTYQSMNGSYEFKKGDKLAQLIPLKPITMAKVVEVEGLSTSDRGDKGFGSSGR
jgi:dUTP pyrophosphatase